MTAQEKERITRLRGEGKSYGAIATLLGISASKVKSYCTMAKSITRIEVKKPDLLQRKRVAAYARVSMDTERLMHSLSVQVSYYSELIQNTPGWEYAGVYADEGISGTKMDSRPEFVRMLADCEAGKIDIHTFTNASAYTIAETNVRIISIEFASKEENHAQFFGQVVVDVVADTVERTAKASGTIVIPFPTTAADTGSDPPEEGTASCALRKRFRIACLSLIRSTGSMGRLSGQSAAKLMPR